jgi:hypothetical protein
VDVMTTAVLSIKLRDVITVARNVLLDKPVRLSLEEVLGIIASVCIDSRVKFAELPSEIAEVRIVALDWSTHHPQREFITLAVVRAFNAALLKN